jgi:RNA polymerase sigma-70 factor, ECF subfamily
VSAAELTDAVLIERVLTGDINAYTALVVRYYGRGARYATRMLGNREDAEEALQDALVRAYRSLAQCEDRTRFDTWLFSILINRCRTTGARTLRRRRTFVEAEPVPDDHGRPAGDDAAAWRDEIVRALARLDVAHREAFVLKHVEELSYDEIASLTGVGVSALKMRVKRACDQLRTLLEEAYCA